MLDAEALQIAAATLPPAAEVKAMADCTVAGSAQVEEAEIDRRRHDARHQQVHRQPKQREQRKGAEEHQQMQLPVAHAGDDRLTRQLGAVHKEQQRDGGGGQVLKEGFPDAFAGNSEATITTKIRTNKIYQCANAATRT